MTVKDIEDIIPSSSKADDDACCESVITSRNKHEENFSGDSFVPGQYLFFS